LTNILYFKANFPLFTKKNFLSRGQAREANVDDVYNCLERDTLCRENDFVIDSRVVLWNSLFLLRRYSRFVLQAASI